MVSDNSRPFCLLLSKQEQAETGIKNKKKLSENIGNNYEKIRGTKFIGVIL